MIKFEINEMTQAFIKKYKLFEEDTVQQIQLQHRLDLAAAFQIKEGMRVLEVGCGQGDTTAALADAVGNDGFVVAMDVASPEYGAPFTLGEAAERIKKSSLGSRVSFHFEADLEDFTGEAPFDVAVLSHCSWYFKHPEDLLRTFTRLRQLAKRICFAEWDLDFTRMDQRAHFCAVSILALYSNFVDNEGNIQNLFHKSRIQELLKEAGFTVEGQLTVDASYLQDAKWEKDYANSIRPEFSKAPEMIQTLVNSYYELMNHSNVNEKSLDSFILCAR
ncbi:class I SAM-dependent methyltransferase [Bacillus infantis]|uniref:Class I SAM-dependent methyltransferase n=1 Tax=Bacillus infantis TaxID=324767 RepID=A0A5D4SFU3_9BACI|nr:class I SAM-dependent methyltransferase [Bacillus infantis]TYS62173.1 class I SAM-dependent methyltransferase [Bacillus infantis]